MSSDNLSYLTSQQALADTATFISSFTADNVDQLADSRCIVFGGSYSGCLAAWLRLKYPHIVHGAIASSAPVHAIVDFSGYLDVVRDTIGPECSTSIEEANQELDRLIGHSSGWETINSVFNLCDPFNGTNSNDVSNLSQNLAANLKALSSIMLVTVTLRLVLIVESC